MASKNQTAQSAAMVTRLAEIADWMRRCREELCAHISKYEKWDDGTHTVSLPSQVATLIHVAWELVDYVVDTLRLKDGQSEPAESQHQTAQDHGDDQAPRRNRCRDLEMLEAPF